LAPAAIGHKLDQRLRAYVTSVGFDMYAAMVVFANAIMIGVRTDWMARNLGETSPAIFTILDVIFCILFVGEIGMRFYVYRLAYFMKADRLWNIADCVVVGLQIVELLMTHQGQHMQANLTAFRALRLLRLVRIVRLARLLRLISELRILVMSILSSLKTLFWTGMLLTLVIYLVGILLTEEAADYRWLNIAGEAADYRPSSYSSSESNIAEDALTTYYGSLDRSMLSLYQAVSGGVDWGDMLTPLSDISFAFGYLFIVYIAFTVFALMNIVGGYFVQSALESSKNEKHNYMIHLVTELLYDLDEDETGRISWEDFSCAMDCRAMQDYFKAIDVDVSEAKSIFNLLDYDKTGTLEPEELINGGLKLQGSARSLDVQLLLAQVGRLNRALVTCSDKGLGTGFGSPLRDSMRSASKSSD